MKNIPFFIASCQTLNCKPSINHACHHRNHACCRSSRDRRICAHRPRLRCVRRFRFSSPTWIPPKSIWPCMFFCLAVMGADEAGFASIEDSSSSLDVLEAEEAQVLGEAISSAQFYATEAQRVATGTAGTVLITHNAQPVAPAIPAAASAIGNTRWGIVIDAGLFLKFSYHALRCARHVHCNSRGD